MGSIHGELVTAKPGSGDEASKRKLASVPSPIKPGKFADIVAVDANPLTDLGTLKNVTFVMKGGKVIKSEN